VIGRGGGRGSENFLSDDQIRLHPSRVARRHQRCLAVPGSWEGSEPPTTPCAMGLVKRMPVWEGSWVRRLGVGLRGKRCRAGALVAKEARHRGGEKKKRVEKRLICISFGCPSLSSLSLSLCKCLCVCVCVCVCVSPSLSLAVSPIPYLLALASFGYISSRASVSHMMPVRILYTLACSHVKHQTPCLPYCLGYTTLSYPNQVNTRNSKRTCTGRDVRTTTRTCLGTWVAPNPDLLCPASLT
jgi:hypothetical protein